MSAEVAMSQDPSVQTLNAVLEALSQGREVAATDVLVEHLDALLLAGEVEKVRHLLPQLDPQRLPPQVLSGVLMVTKAAKEALGEEWITFFERVRAALSETWGLGPEQVAAICRRHA